MTAVLYFDGVDVGSMESFSITREKTDEAPVIAAPATHEFSFETVIPLDADTPNPFEPFFQNVVPAKPVVDLRVNGRKLGTLTIDAIDAESGTITGTLVPIPALRPSPATLAMLRFGRMIHRMEKKARRQHLRALAEKLRGLRMAIRLRSFDRSTDLLHRPEGVSDLFVRAFTDGLQKHLADFPDPTDHRRARFIVHHVIAALAHLRSVAGV